MAVAAANPQMAGQRFNIPRTELMRLLADDDSENITIDANALGLNPNNQTDTPTTQTQETVVNKGRGSVLGYNIGGQPTRYTTTVSPIIGGAIGDGGGGDDGGDTTPSLKKYYGTVGGVGVTDIGEQGFGMKDYNAAIDAGYDPESIKEYINANRANIFNIGPDARKVLGITDYESTAPGAYDYSALGGAGFGMEELKDLQNRNVDDATIRTLAQQAPMLGPDAASSLGIQASAKQKAEAYKQSQGASIPTPSYDRPTGENTTTVTGYGLGRGDGSGFNYEAFGGGGFGLEDVKALQSKGASLEDMKKIARSAPGGLIGGGAREFLGL